jgi:hypothetical protein
LSGKKFAQRIKIELNTRQDRGKKADVSLRHICEAIIPRKKKHIYNEEIKRTIETSQKSYYVQHSGKRKKNNKIKLLDRFFFVLFSFRSFVNLLLFLLLFYGFVTTTHFKVFGEIKNDKRI